MQNGLCRVASVFYVFLRSRGEDRTVFNVLIHRNAPVWLESNLGHADTVGKRESKYKSFIDILGINSEWPGSWILF